MGNLPGRIGADFVVGHRPPPARPDVSVAPVRVRIVSGGYQSGTVMAFRGDGTSSGQWFVLADLAGYSRWCDASDMVPAEAEQVIAIPGLYITHRQGGAYHGASEWPADKPRQEPDTFVRQPVAALVYDGSPDRDPHWALLANGYRADLHDRHYWMDVGFGRTVSSQRLESERRAYEDRQAERRSGA